jgi:hypothetical protein
MPDTTDRPNWIVNQEEQQATFLNSSGLKEEPRKYSPWSTGHGPCPEPEPIRIHGYPMDVGRIRGFNK